MLPDRSVYVVACMDGSSGLDPICERVHLARLHVTGLEIWCPEGGLGSGRVALEEAQRSWRWVPPLRRSEAPGPGSVVVGMPRGLSALQETAHDRLASVVHGRLGDLGLVAVMGWEPGRLQWALYGAMHQVGRKGDGLLAVDEEASLPLVLGSGAPEAATWEQRVCATRWLDPQELRGELHQRGRRWVYTVRYRGDVVGLAPLTGRQGAALRAVILQPSADAMELDRMVRGGKPMGDRLEDVERARQRVDQWFSRVRGALRGWPEKGLGAFVPAPRTREVTGIVDIVLDADLPWLPFTEAPCPLLSCSTSSTTGSI